MSNIISPQVEFFFNEATKWQKEYVKLRTLILDCGLTEELKWGVPCYTFSKKNVILIHGFKEFCAVLFHKGTLLKDDNNLLVQQTQNVQAARQMRFSSLEEIVEKAPLLKAYIFEAIEVEKAGLKVNFKKTTEYKVPEEFQKELEANNKLKTAFDRLTPGRQRGYLLYFSQPKQSKTREARIEKYLQKIINGQGLND